MQSRKLQFCSSLSALRIFASTALMISLLQPLAARASLPVGTNDIYLTSFAAAPNGGFWLQIDPRLSNRDGTYNIDGAPNLGEIRGAGSIIARPGGVGYWIVAPYGGIVERGDAPVLCRRDLSTCSGFQSGRGGDIVAAAATPDGMGLWALGQDGAVWTAGTAQSYGDKKRGWCYPSCYASGMASTPTGRGYVLLHEDGTISAFGDAKHYGDSGGRRPNGTRATGIALSRNINGDVNGYWVAYEDGGVRSYGGAPFLGSTGGDNGGSKVVNLIALSNGRSYAWIHQDGRVEFSRPPANVTDLLQDRPCSGEDCR